MQELCSLMANCLRRSGVASCNGMAPTPLAQQVHERSTWNPPHTIGIDQRCRRLRSAIALRKWSRGVGVSSGSVPPLGSSRELPLTRTPRHVLIFAATSSAEGQVLEVKRTLVARTSQCPVPAGAAAEPLKPSVSSQPGAVYRCIASTDNSWSGADGNQQLVSDSLVREEDAPLSQSSLDLPAYFAGAKISHVQPLHAPCPAGHRT